MDDGGRRDERICRPQTGGRIRYVCSCEVPERELSEARNIGLDVITPWCHARLVPPPLRPRFSRVARDDPPSHRTRGYHGRPRAWWYANGTLLEVLCVGTAVIVTAIHRIGFEGRDIHSPKYPSDENGLGPVGRALRAKILGVQDEREEYEG